MKDSCLPIILISFMKKPCIWICSWRTARLRNARFTTSRWLIYVAPSYNTSELAINIFIPWVASQSVTQYDLDGDWKLYGFEKSSLRVTWKEIAESRPVVLHLLFVTDTISSSSDEDLVHRRWSSNIPLVLVRAPTLRDICQQKIYTVIALPTWYARLSNEGKGSVALWQTKIRILLHYILASTVVVAFVEGHDFVYHSTLNKNADYNAIEWYSASLTFCICWQSKFAVNGRTLSSMRPDMCIALECQPVKVEIVIY